MPPCSSTMHCLASPPAQYICVVPGSPDWVMFFFPLKWWTLQTQQLLLWVCFTWCSLTRGNRSPQPLWLLLTSLQPLSCPAVTVNIFRGVVVLSLLFNFSTLCSKVISFLASLSTVSFNFYLTVVKQWHLCGWAPISYRLPPPVKCCDTLHPIPFSHSFWSWFFWALLFDKFALDNSTWLALLAFPNSFRDLFS